ncbi:hypothetical protein AMTRI_Chr04g244570 [Amborella trichopoda]|uniref:DUF7734 domain-containing protein n=1 Tax=Amborella trichopoda TaxID=13333 RepID=W1PUJ8_AMBTC|nr:uncharacterized protein LOC18439557 [Amborella trichopoda]ERN11381.1 hypothetical protein AMTR_s00176p00047500 [Amborella trichopoda]|eukprot:XP_006849800.1 uncharacterized protein LOC18439557 [Amborella trichopoda]
MGTLSSYLLQLRRLTPITTAKPFQNYCHESQKLFLSAFRDSTFVARPKFSDQLPDTVAARARRQLRPDENEDEDDYGQNTEIGMLETYSESERSEVLLVRALVDDQEEEVLIFKGFSSLLSGRTSYDLSKCVLPARAIIKSIDIIKGPFDPSNIEYLEKDLKWEDFKHRLNCKS